MSDFKLNKKTLNNLIIGFTAFYPINVVIALFAKNTDLQTALIKNLSWLFLALLLYILKRLYFKDDKPDI